MIDRGTVFVTGLIVVLAAVTYFLMKWYERCPRCKSMWGPKVLRASYSPDSIYKTSQKCRDCGHEWATQDKIDPMAP